MYTPKASFLLNQRNPLFRSTGFNTLAAAAGVATVADGSFPTGDTKDLQSSSIQLSVVPDKLFFSYGEQTLASLAAIQTII